MAEVDVLRWRVRLDVERTRAAYSRTARGGAAECPCTYCRNYVQQREHAFPPSVLQILETLHIPVEKDLEFVSLRARRSRGAAVSVALEVLGWAGELAEARLHTVVPDSVGDSVDAAGGSLRLSTSPTPPAKPTRT